MKVIYVQSRNKFNILIAKVKPKVRAVILFHYCTIKFPKIVSF